MDRENGIKESFRYAGVRKRDLLKQRVLKLAIVKWSPPQSTAFKKWNSSPLILAIRKTTHAEYPFFPSRSHPILIYFFLERFFLSCYLCSVSVSTKVPIVFCYSRNNSPHCGFSVS
ncbi:hypothetical protein CEXT_689251 [Caerostris extrusa]|uniref:Uncharacterized protein n=1 Tax=Caerostris extrusa TaxID=172846 RepID=A0AAV4RQ43_CAEEX|nr:hypothetical protein CEXT_689251 [Caerostris extrusa]